MAIGILVGLPKYLIFTPLTVVGFISMYIFGGVIITFINTVGNLLSGDFIHAFIEYFINSALPPSSIQQVLLQVVAGTLIAGSKWFIAMLLRGSPL